MRRRKPRTQLGVAGVLGLDDRASSVEAHDHRRPLKGAEHHDDPAVLAHVGDRLGAAANEIEIRNGAGVEDPQAVEALRREIQMGRCVDRRPGEPRRTDTQTDVSMTTMPGAILLPKLGRIEFERHAAHEILQLIDSRAAHDFAQRENHRVRLGSKTQRGLRLFHQVWREDQGGAHIYTYAESESPCPAVA